MTTSTTSTSRPSGSRTRPVPAGRAPGRAGSRGGHRPAPSVVGAARWAAVLLLASGVVLMHAVLGMAPVASGSPTSPTGHLADHLAGHLDGSRTSTAAPAAITRAGTPSGAHSTGSPSSVSVLGVSSSVVVAQVPPDVVDVGQGAPSGDECVHCQGGDHAMSLGHLCLAVVGGLLLAGAAVWARRRHRLPVLDLFVRRSEQGPRPPARAVLGVPPWSHLSLSQLSLLRV